MSAKLKIADGNPVWLSASIVPSKDTAVSPNSSPSVAAIQVTSTDVFLYVKVENTGTVDLGTCPCTNTGAWTTPTFFQGFYASKTGTTSTTQFGVTFNAGPAGDSLSGAVSFSFGPSASGRRAWAWSADGRFFAYVTSLDSLSGTVPVQWFLTIVTLQDITRSNGSKVAKGQVAVSANGIFPNQNWTNAQFGWAKNNAVVATSKYVGGSGWVFALACPEAPSPGTWGNLFPDSQDDWAFLTSPCGGALAFAPKTPQKVFSLLSTATAAPIQFRKNNVVTSVSSTGSNVSITTNAHTANGVTINTGNGTLVTVDDPECTLVGNGILVRVDRVKASTLPTANLGVLPVGTATIGQLKVGEKAWAKVPNLNGWSNQSEKHWCLLAQAYTVDGTTVLRAWDGQAAAPPPFPIGNENCAQRNIEINP